MRSIRLVLNQLWRIRPPASGNSVVARDLIRLPFVFTASQRAKPRPSSDHRQFGFRQFALIATDRILLTAASLTIRMQCNVSVMPGRFVYAGGEKRWPNHSNRKSLKSLDRAGICEAWCGRWKLPLHRAIMAPCPAFMTGPSAAPHADPRRWRVARTTISFRRTYCWNG
jgi:hypothetical protein